MAAYDSPGFRGATPIGDFDQRSGTATGSVPSRTPSPDNSVPGGTSGLPGVGTVLPLASQAGTGEGASPQQPGQVDSSIISPGPADGYTSTGASGSGSLTDHWSRKPGQQEAGNG